MNSHQKRTVVASVVAFLVLTALFLLLLKTPLVIAAYFFSLLAVIMCAGIFYLVSGSTKQNYFINASFLPVVFKYSVVNIVFSAFAVLLSTCSVWTMPLGLFILIQIFFAAVLVWMFLGMRSGQDLIGTLGSRVSDRVCGWKELLTETEIIRNHANASSVKEVAALCDAIRYADPASTPALAGLEEEIKHGLAALRQMLDENQMSEIPVLCQKLLVLVKERSTRMKAEK